MQRFHIRNVNGFNKIYDISVPLIFFFTFSLDFILSNFCGFDETCRRYNIIIIIIAIAAADLSPSLSLNVTMMAMNRIALRCNGIGNRNANSCVADNALGRTKKYIEISGRPGPAEFISPTFSGSLEVYNLTWSVESIPPLEEIRLLYRRLMVRFSKRKNYL